VQIEGQRDRIPGSSNWSKGHRNAEGKDGRYSQLAGAKKRQVQKFLGLANYYRRLIKDFARIAALLHVLVRKKQK